ncbi:hypothetical protein NITUZ_140077 [Candidatus Nitrosotenuis uzonensis]|uniref:Uncharacterized protein n=1 Tax=Candidatus Nitrosotenuis uzonensis TaxID=1407055 RepID=V6AQT8_9ARCH|nr:hypothetical protein NITUZ_140077 [Candidatus Nitrosotenuis uzonensis]
MSSKGQQGAIVSTICGMANVSYKINERCQKLVCGKNRRQQDH